MKHKQVRLAKVGAAQAAAPAARAAVRPTTTRRWRTACLAAACSVAVAGCTATYIATPVPLPSGTIRLATFGPGGRISGTDFVASVPAGFGNGERAFAGNTFVEVALKKIPMTSPGPGIIVTVSQAPPELNLAPYGDIMYHQDLQDDSGSKVQVNSALHSASVAGQTAEEYTDTDAGGTEDWTVIVLYDGLSYVIQLVAPASQFASASARPFTAFLASWHWR
jgi:hypothetical protein